MAVREPEKQSNKISLYKLCTNHWMTDKLCMHREQLKGSRGKLAEVSIFTLEKQSCMIIDSFSTGCISQVCRVWATGS